jgi:hypothetical protein
VAVHEGRAVFLGEHAGFYELTAGSPDAPASAPIAFAANLLDASESAVAPQDQLVVDGKTAGEVGGFHLGVRRDVWVYLLLAAALLTAVEWGTYHRRVTI